MSTIRAPQREPARAAFHTRRPGFGPWQRGCGGTEPRSAQRNPLPLGSTAREVESGDSRGPQR
eukprot:9830238-Lingulodinium_polyedra.AAC.1